MTSDTTFPRFWGATDPFLILISLYHHGNHLKSNMAAPQITHVMIHDYIISVILDQYYNVWIDLVLFPVIDIKMVYITSKTLTRV